MIPTPQSVTIHRYTLGTADAHGNAAESWVADAAPTLVHAVAPGASAEALQTGRDVSQVAWTVYAPQGVSVAARDRIVWRGATYLRMLHRVVRVVAGMVVRLLSNPAGASSVTEQAGPFSTTATHGSGVGDVHLTEADRRILRGVTDADRGRAFTLWPGVAC